MYNLLNLLLLTLTGVTSTDIRSFPSPCSNEWITSCSIDALLSGLKSVVDDVTTSGEANMDYSTYKTDEGFFPVITEKPDSLEYGISDLITYLGGYSPKLTTEARPDMEAGLGNNVAYCASDIELGVYASPTSVVACSQDMTSDFYATYLTYDQSIGSIICDGTTSSACNAWVAASLLGEMKIDINSISMDALTTKFSNSEYDYEGFTVALVNSTGYTFPDAYMFQPSSFGEYAEISNATYAGWIVPVTIMTEAYDVVILHTVGEAETTVPIDSWESLALDATACSPVPLTAGCDPLEYVSVILGNIGASTATVGDLTTQINNGDFDMGFWAPELRELSTGDFVAGTAAESNRLAEAEEVWFVAAEALATGMQKVEFTIGSNPYASYVMPVGSDHYVQVSYMNSESFAPSRTPSRAPVVEPPTASGSMGLLATIGSLILLSLF